MITPTRSSTVLKLLPKNTDEICSQAFVVHSKVVVPRCEDLPQSNRPNVSSTNALLAPNRSHPIDRCGHWLSPRWALSAPPLLPLSRHPVHPGSRAFGVVYSPSAMRPPPVPRPSGWAPPPMKPTLLMSSGCLFAQARRVLDKTRQDK